MANPYPLECWQNQQASFNITLPVNIQGLNIDVSILTGLSAVLLKPLITVLDAALGKINLTFMPDQTTLSGRFYSSIKVIRNDDTVRNEYISTFTIIKTSNEETTPVVQPIPGEIRAILSPLVRVWTLIKIPKKPDISSLYINGQKQIYGLDYYINSAVITWIGYELKPDWTIELYYK